MSRSRQQRNTGGQTLSDRTAEGKVIRSNYCGYGSNRQDARNIKGAKKFINSRRRFHEKAALAEELRNQAGVV